MLLVHPFIYLYLRTAHLIEVSEVVRHDVTQETLHAVLYVEGNNQLLGLKGRNISCDMKVECDVRGSGLPAALRAPGLFLADPINNP